jgi:hypothetical protein
VGIASKDEEAFVNKFGTSSVYFKVNNLAGKNMTFEVKETADKIEVSKSYYKVKSGRAIYQYVHSYTIYTTPIRLSLQTW